MSYDAKEISLGEGNPVECYAFTYLDHAVNLTSSQRAITLNGVVYTPAYIRRDETLHLGNSGGTMDACKITVGRDSEIAHLYKQTPPEDDSVKVSVYRVHRDDLDSNKHILLVKGIISQVTFNDSEAELTISIENGLNRYVPRGILSYYCQNNIYDNKCRVPMSENGHVCELDIGIEGIRVFSRRLKNDFENGFFDDGLLDIGGFKRAIVRHYNNYVEIKYPLPDSCKDEEYFTVYPSCGNTFYLCHKRFNNIDNFTGVPIIPPYNAFTHPTHGKDNLQYWGDSPIVRRDSKGEIYQVGV